MATRNLGILTYSANNGLGIQTQALAEHLSPHKIMLVDLSPLNKAKQYPERFPGVAPVMGIPTKADIDAFLVDIDVVMVAETPLNYYLFSRAKELGVKTVQIPNWEFLDYFTYPHWTKPDMIISPSMWHYDELKKFSDDNGILCEYIHHPVDRDKLPARKITKAKTFLHIAGKPAAHDRAGTNSVIEAAGYTDAEILLHFHGEQGLAHQLTHTTEDYRQKLRGNVTMRVQEFDNYQDIYSVGDVMVMPRRYGGNNLPLNEALSIGMPVIMPDIEPNNNILPKEWLVPAMKTGEFTPRTKVDIYSVDPKALAEKIDWFRSLSEEEMLAESRKAIKIAESISWPVLKPKYLEALNKVLGRK
jgi:glycosyltransferase involved in cell wall biosynthesis